MVLIIEFGFEFELMNTGARVCVWWGQDGCSLMTDVTIMFE